MRTVLIGSLRLNSRRYVASTIAIVLAVAFIVWTNALASSAKAGMSGQVADVYRNADLVARIDNLASNPTATADAFMQTATKLGGTALVTGIGNTQVTTARGAAFGQNSGTSFGVIGADSALNWQKLSAGRLPRADTEAVVDAKTAKASGVGIGDTLTMQTDSVPVELKVVGITQQSGSYDRASIYVPWQTARLTANLWNASIQYRAGPSSPGEAAVRSQLGAIDGIQRVQPRQTFVDDEVQKTVTNGIDVLGYMVLLFAAIAAFVAVLVIANTFTIVFAQRTRDFALLRCVGATRRQVRRSVRLEALAMALASSTLGLLVGVLGGFGLVALLRLLVGASWFGAVSLSPSWLVGAFALGTVATVVAAWWPTRAVTKIPPLAALRTDAVVAVRTRAGWLRIALGLGLVAGGSGLLYLAMSRHNLIAMVSGGVASFLGVLLLGPIIVPAVIRVLSIGLGRLGLPMRIASDNALRNPRRTATTTASLLVGVTLTTAILSGVASVQSSADSALNADAPIDATIVSTTGLPSTTAGQVAKVSGVSQAAAVMGTMAHLPDGDSLVVAPDAEAANVTHSPSGVVANDHEALVPPTSGLASHPTLTMSTDSGTLTLKTRPVSGLDAIVVSQSSLKTLTDTPKVMAVWASTTSDADAEAVATQLGNIAGPTSTVGGGASMRQLIGQVLFIVTSSVLGLLAIAIVIALVGIANTLGLSVLERHRENSLLRALGLTRRQLRRTLAAEGALLAIVAVILGGALGVAFGWVGLETMASTAIGAQHLVFVVPWGTLSVVALVAILSGLLAAALPGRKAAQTTPAEGLALQ